MRRDRQKEKPKTQHFYCSPTYREGQDCRHGQHELLCEAVQLRVGVPPHGPQAIHHALRNLANGRQLRQVVLEAGLCVAAYFVRKGSKG